MIFEVAVMPNSIGSGYGPIANELLGLIDYYKIVFEDKELIKKETELRNHRLSLILGLIDTIAIPEDLMTELKSTIIDGWRLKVPGSTKTKRSMEVGMVLGSLEQLRKDIGLTLEQPGHQFNWQLDVDVIKSISIRRLDFEIRRLQEHLTHWSLGSGARTMSEFVDIIAGELKSHNPQ
jgi:hypothetical protein